MNMLKNLYKINKMKIKGKKRKLIKYHKMEEKEGARLGLG